ncbi:MAG: hypothetical protein ABF420_11040 [Acetobacter syzygii]|uniref:hypothetical protein n=1 Tax=Acetobacter syzygii TaxID=146476 RepID=UPI0039EC5D00
MAKELHSGKAEAPARQAAPPRKPAARRRTKEEIPAPPPRRALKSNFLTYARGAHNTRVDLGGRRLN